MHSKKTHKQDEKTTLRKGENICKQSKWQGINLQNIQTAHAAQYQVNKQSNPKMGGRLDIFSKKSYELPTNTWKDAQHH